MRWILTLSLMLSLMVSGGTATANPLAKAAQESLEVQGVVAERLPAGSYTYLRIQGKTALWLATMGPGAAVGQAVTAKSFARADDFQSRRLKRRFEVLHFGTVTPK
jgi:hypothetical protein